MPAKLTRDEERQLHELARYGLMQARKTDNEPSKNDVGRLADALRVLARRRMLGPIGGQLVQDVGGRKIAPIPDELMPPKVPTPLKTAAMLAVMHDSMGERAMMDLARRFAVELPAMRRVAERVSRSRLAGLRPRPTDVAWQALHAIDGSPPSWKEAREVGAALTLFGRRNVMGFGERARVVQGEANPEKVAGMMARIYRSRGPEAMMRIARASASSVQERRRRARSEVRQRAR
ncbi:hypothetical protein HYS54_04480 [Candidatus Micrarchaeota archaeon]|nr:hypothetical protein [Candidatus Micrarchaeota archaeon]